MVPAAEVKIKEKDGILKIMFLFLELFAMRTNPEQKRIQEQRKIMKRDIAPFVDT